jgi:hypothetical protein
MAKATVKVDFKQFAEFAKKIEKLNKEGTKELVEGTIKELSGRLLAQVKKLTPVGDPPPRPPKAERTVQVKSARGKTRKFASAAEARWQEYWKGYKGGSLRRAWTAQPLTGEGNKYSIKIINPWNYALYVEKGHRQEIGRFVPAIGKKLTKGFVEGRHMLKKSVMALDKKKDNIVKSNVKRFFDKFKR